MDELRSKIGLDMANDEYIAAIYRYYLDSLPHLLDDLDRLLYDGEPRAFKHTLEAIGTSSGLVSAKRVAQAAKQMLITLDRLPFISRTFLGVEIARLRMEFHATKAEIELLLESVKR